ncbi:MAG TPA: zinc-ribbon domain-containing protein [Pyrinomonadaceae bacterium]
MICSNCGTEIPLNERFCRNCGHEAIPLAATLHAGAPTLRGTPAELSSHRDAAAETARIWAAPSTGPISAPLPTVAPRRSPFLLPLVAGLVLLALIGTGVLAYFLLKDKEAGAGTEAVGPLPDHFGVFLRSGESLTELRRMDFNDAIKGRDAMLGDATLPRAEARPTLILYAEAQDIPTSDLKLVQLDGIDPSGSVRYWNFQVAPIEGGRRGMKQIRIPDGLASGKYALALMRDYLNEGNHKFWPFQVTEGAPSPGTPQVATMQVKSGPASGPTPKPPTTSPTQTSTTTPPSAPPTTGTLVYCNDDNVVLRASPSLTGAKVNKLMRGQKLWAIGVSSNKSSWGGVTANWTHVQLYDRSQTGWVFSPFISY